MTETVVHVTTIEEWKSVLDIWFKQGYEWSSGGKNHGLRIFENGGRFLFLDDDITWSRIGRTNHDSEPYIEYSEFMSKQKEDNKMAKVYEVSQAVFDRLQMIKAHERMSLIEAVTLSAQFIKSLEVGNKAILRYLADDPAIEFKVKEQLYRLWRFDEDRGIVYMTFTDTGIPDWTIHEDEAFTAKLEEIKKWKTPAWDIEKAD